MSSQRRKPKLSGRHFKEEEKPEQFVTSEVELVKTGARIVWITTVLIAVVIIFVFLTAAFIAIPEWRPYLINFLNLLGKALEGIFKFFK